MRPVIVPRYDLLPCIYLGIGQVERVRTDFARKAYLRRRIPFRLLGYSAKQNYVQWHCPCARRDCREVHHVRHKFHTNYCNVSMRGLREPVEKMVRPGGEVLE